MRERLRFIARQWRPLRAWFGVLSLVTLASTAVAVAYPLVLRHVIDRLHGPTADVSGDTDAMLYRSVALLLGIAVLSWFAGLYPAVRAYLNARIEKQVRERYFDHLLRKGEGFFRSFRTGDLAIRLTDDISDYPKIAWFCCSGIFRAVESTSKLVFCLLVMASLDGTLTLLAAAPLPLMIGVFLTVHRKFGDRILAQRQATSRTSSLLEASFAGVAIIKAFDAADRQSRALREQLTERIDREMDLVRFWQLVDGLYGTLSQVGQVIVVAAGGLMVLKGEMTIGTFYAFYAYLGMLVAPLFDIPNLFVTGKQAFVCIDRVEEIRTTDAAGEGRAFQGDRAVEAFRDLAVRDARFAYDGRDVVAGVDLDIARGERVALVGRLGSGKSTLLRMAAGSLVPSHGEVTLNGHPLGEHDAVSVSRRVAVVPQEPVLFSESIRDNVLLGRERDDQRLTEVLDAVGLSDEIAGFPEGLEQRVGPRGVSLSGGQRQRLSIARALYGEPELLLLDDLTSALDAENEERLWASLGRAAPDATALVVTHRMATAQAMDRIAVMDGGRIVAAGSHEDLLRSSALYRELQPETA